MQILQLDIQGFPQAWISPSVAATYYATDSVCWTLGDVCATLRGGMNAATGRQSKLDLHPIIALNGASKVNLLDSVPALTNRALFRRDLWTCAYCGKFHPGGVGLTRDHINPKAQQGEDTWMNTISACKLCNGRKDCFTPEEAGMPLLFMPYVPSVYEQYLLLGRNIRGDVHEWLASKVSKDSRWHASRQSAPVLQ